MEAQTSVKITSASRAAAAAIVRGALAAIKDRLLEVGDGLHIGQMEQELLELREEMNAPGFWDDLDRSRTVNQHIAAIEAKIGHYNSLRTMCDDIEIMMELADGETDQAMANEAGAELEKLIHQVDMLALETLMRGDYDRNNAILSLHAGAGGTEAQDWTQMLYRMYTRYCERMGFKVTINDMLEGDEAGIKSVTFQVEGDNAYGYLRSERGVHRLVRISPFDSNARRHTSFSSLDVAPVLPEDDKFEVNMEEVRIDTYRAGGAGGQPLTGAAAREAARPEAPTGSRS